MLNRKNKITRLKFKLYVIAIVLIIFCIFLACDKVKAQNNNSNGDNQQSDHSDLFSEPSSSEEPFFDISQRTDFPPLDDEEAYVEWMLKHTQREESFIRWCWQRAAIAIGRSDLTTEKAVMAFLLTPREVFAREYNRGNAYADNYLSIGYGQTISGPHCVSRMTSELDVESHHKVLEIGTGSGYQSAVLAQLSNWIYSIEVIEPLAQETEIIYNSVIEQYPEYKNVHRQIGDGYYGWLEYAPFDRIIVTCGIDHIPPPLLQQLKPEGIMLIPVGPPYHQHILKITKHVNEDGKISFDEYDIYNGREVPFVNFTVDGTNLHSVERDRPEL